MPTRPHRRTPSDDAKVDPEDYYLRHSLPAHTFPFLPLSPYTPLTLDLTKKPAMPSRIPITDDPLTLALSPPLNETPLEREDRLAAEYDAKMVSEAPGTHILTY